MNSRMLVGAVAVANSDANVVYVGMGEHAPRGVMTTYGDGVYKSTDAGKTWQHLGLEMTPIGRRPHSVGGPTRSFFKNRVDSPGGWDL